MAEAIGIREVLSWVKENGYSNTTIESDCLQLVQLVQAIRSSLFCFSYLGRVINDCREMLASLSHKNISFRFVKRSANRVAYYLGRYSYSVADLIWRGECPPWFSSCIVEWFTVLMNSIFWWQKKNIGKLNIKYIFMSLYIRK